MAITELTHKDLEKLASIIVSKIQKEFAVKHLSKNLVNTIKVENLGDQINIVIPAQIYDIAEYKRTKIVKHTGKGSYASDLDKNSKNHTGYVEKVINMALQEWKSSYTNATIKKEEF